ncbi:hypothetical protein GCM10009678_36150 [Actinomadura kijaniata]|uniref:NAD(P)-dependent dehydrogenase (Short-subunit alcohol dehydrogenase family) n=1 Tax=Actinomadura namibiensis TaxID=182080 RepID=A0A7W3LQ38_ACTNM|nr:SDR family NAD(P)-dependent oxidoreductase [Actinomadura namibiensis]MBA8952209.1 NAD(P)-dependent dehydrogenase (short-subunit alcohol dehydrogenase family) [Actinomadura namibiensis]
MGYPVVARAGAVVAITGGARGIGRAAAEALAARGARVWIGDRDEERARRTAEETGARAFGVDVSDRASFAAFLAAVEAAGGPLDILGNNAGIMPLGPFLDEPDAVSAATLDVNVRGVLDQAATREGGPR